MSARRMKVTATEEQLVDVLFGERAGGGSASRV
jgi:hypothetical protein